MHRNRQAAKAAALHNSAQHTTDGPCPHCTDTLELLDMLGLLDGRDIIPDPTGDADRPQIVATLDGSGGNSPFAQGRLAAHTHAPYRPGQCETTPPGLRAFIAETAELAKTPPKAKREPKPKPEAAKPEKVAPAAVIFIEPETKPPPRGRPRTPATDRGLNPPTPDDACGTLTGRNHHAKRGEDMCDPCREEFNTWQRTNRRRVPEEDRKRAARAPCGTPHGVKSHKAHGEEPCDPCWEAKRAQARNYWHALPQEKRQQINQRRMNRKAELKAQAEDAEAQAS